ncbi:hypothetical protein D9757_012039 [Collybiopsis confluens]|uniref:Uncharacterized protein n=1 Tax=Collybiopsis confluens TaxID=2823264 RepID=A0A8H5GDM8_9AGAR|nr:hypothetical protein D9757_012039 [Collybiopsis confluens]
MSEQTNAYSSNHEMESTGTPERSNPPSNSYFAQRGSRPSFPRDILLPGTPGPLRSSPPPSPATRAHPSALSFSISEHEPEIPGISTSFRESSLVSPRLPRIVPNVTNSRKHTRAEQSQSQSLSLHHPSTIIKPSTTKRPKANNDHPVSAQSYNELLRKYNDIKAQLAQEKKARTTAETHLYRVQQKCVDSGLNASHIDLLQALAIAQGESETQKAKSDEVQQEVASLKAEREDNMLLVNRYRREAELDRKEVEDLRYEVERLREANNRRLDDYDHHLREADRMDTMRGRGETRARNLHHASTTTTTPRLDRRRDEYVSGPRWTGRHERSRESLEDRAFRSTNAELERDDELSDIRVELARERAMRMQLTRVVDEMDREDRAPSLVPALVDALTEISRRTRSHGGG